MPLYEVEYRIRCVVEADDGAHIYDVAKNCKSEVMSEQRPTVIVGREIKRIKDLPSEWDGMCIPYSGDGNTRIKDLLP